jgi:O-acetyl-ADP-ribose deacetylase (regulator of RNase III)
MARLAIGVDEGDIALARNVDAVLNAAHYPNLHGGGVSTSIWRHAGPLLSQDIALQGGCRVGEVKLTPGYNLAAAWIIHTCRPRWDGGASGEPDQLRRCYRNVFTLAGNVGLRSVATPVIGSGSTGFPLRLSATIGFEEARRALTVHVRLEEVVFTIPDDRGYDLTLLRWEMFGDELETV